MNLINSRLELADITFLQVFLILFLILSCWLRNMPLYSTEVASFCGKIFCHEQGQGPFLNSLLEKLTRNVFIIIFHLS